MLKVPGWEMSIVWYFFLGGIAGGAYFTGAIADNFGGARDRSVARVGYLLSLPLVAICGVLLIADLGVRGSWGLCSSPRVAPRGWRPSP